jgi:anaerobic ribonucleoside-triphosphate reductase
MMETILEHKIVDIHHSPELIQEKLNLGIEDLNSLKELPENLSMFKCHSCMTIFDIFSHGIPVMMALCDKEHILCPECKSDKTELICKVDAYSIYLKLNGFICRKGKLMSGVSICPVCNTPICPQCFNHNVVSLSRVTGYIQDVSGWNVGKKQELKDRKRYILGE